MPFSLGLTGLHALMGIVFIALIALKVTNNTATLGRYHRSRLVLGTTTIVLALTSPEPESGGTARSI